MADKDKDKDKDKAKKPQSKGDGKAKAHGQPQEKAKAADKDKAKAKSKEAADAGAKEAKEEKPKPPPRPPADPRLKYIKKFYGKFLPRGPLRDRHKALMERWNSGDDHGGVTVEELKSLHTDWRTAREKPAKKAPAGV
jgi:hypothetical protein